MKKATFICFLVTCLVVPEISFADKGSEASAAAAILGALSNASKEMKHRQKTKEIVEAELAKGSSYTMTIDPNTGEPVYVFYREQEDTGE